jgi:surfeit locus 1 family protein
VTARAPLALNSPRFWLLTGAALLGVAVTLSLGFWQLSRAAQKEALMAAIRTQASLPPLQASDLAGAALPASLVHRQIVLRGRWVPAATVFLDNRQMHGTPGFFVLTPLVPESGGRPVLVQRGWVQRNFIDRSKLPDVATPPGVVEVQGRIAPPPSKLYEFSAAGSGPIRQNLDLAAFSVETHLPLMGVTLLQTGGSGDGLQRDWPEADLGIAKHYGYAFQWWGLSALIATLYVWFQIVRRIRFQRAP